MASLSPDLVLQGKYPRLIDEWQEVSPLWDAIRFEVDKHNKKGKCGKLAVEYLKAVVDDI